jgi:hypothetical protein
MLSPGQVCSFLIAIALVLVFGDGVAGVGLNTSYVTNGNEPSLVLQIKDKKKKHKDSQNGDDGSELTTCTIQSAGGGGGCKTGFNYKCEKMKSGKKCCGCVAAKGTDTSATPKGTDAAQDQVDTQNKADGRFGVDFDPLPPAQ